MIGLAAAAWVVIYWSPSFAALLTPSLQASPSADARLPDFFQDYASARNRVEGRGIYESLDSSYLRFTGDSSHRFPTFDRNAHPPTSVLLLLPLGRLDFPAAGLAWNLLSLAALAMSLWLIGRELKPAGSRWSILLASPALLLCYPLWDQVQRGQLSATLLLLLTGAWACLRSGRPAASGALVALAASIKIFPLFIFYYLIINK